MTTWYAFRGELTFGSAAEAIAAYDSLVRDAQSILFEPAGGSRVVRVDGATLHVDDENFTGNADALYDTMARFRELAKTAIAGRVRCDDGDPDAGGDRYYVIAKSSE